MNGGGWNLEGEYRTPAYEALAFAVWAAEPSKKAIGDISKMALPST